MMCILVIITGNVRTQALAKWEVHVWKAATIYHLVIDSREHYSPLAELVLACGEPHSW